MGFCCAISSSFSNWGSVVFYCVMSMIEFALTLIMLILYLTKVDFAVQANWHKIELNFSAVGAIVFLLISSIVVGRHNELLTVAAVSIHFYKFIVRH